MRKKQFKAESKKILDLMINSIYTHKEIFLRELISNASDAIDKLYFKSLTDDSVGLTKEDFCIKIDIDKDNRTITITDNGIGMTADELEHNLGTIAKSGSREFKDSLNDEQNSTEIIGQFGVGFYSAFMVSDNVLVKSRAFGSDEGNLWKSSGVDGFTIEPCELDSTGTSIVLHLKDDTENDNYSEFLDTYRLSALVKKYSDYIKYPIKMDFESSKPIEGKENEYESFIETRTVNSMIPLWRKNKNEITEEEYNNFYSDKFYDYEKPVLVIHSKTEGQVTYDALLYIPKKAPYNYYTKDYEKGLQLYSNGVLIMDKCSELLPDYFSFVRGLVDSADLSLNISREMLQHDHQLKLIEHTLEKKIKNELLKLQKNDREAYDEFFKAFGIQLKYGLYEGFGTNREMLEELVMFYSSSEKKYATLKEYASRMTEGQDKIYYACGESYDKIDMLPQTDAVKSHGFEILYCVDNVDEFALQILHEYDGKQFINVCADELDLDTEEEKESNKEKNEQAKDMLESIKNILGDRVSNVRFTSKLKDYPVCLSSEGQISTEMEKILNSMPSETDVKAKTILEINSNHPIADKLQELFDNDSEDLEIYATLLYDQARLISGMGIENPAQFSKNICDILTK